MFFIISMLMHFVRFVFVFLMQCNELKRFVQCLFNYSSTTFQVLSRCQQKQTTNNMFYYTLEVITVMLSGIITGTYYEL